MAQSSHFPLFYRINIGNEIEFDPIVDYYLSCKEATHLFLFLNSIKLTHIVQDS